MEELVKEKLDRLINLFEQVSMQYKWEFIQASIGISIEALIAAQTVATIAVASSAAMAGVSASS